MDKKSSLPIVLGSLCLIASVLVGVKLVYDMTILNFWSSPWVFGILSTMILLGIGLGLIASVNAIAAKQVLKLFGFIYALVTLSVYTSWGLMHTLGTTELNGSIYYGLPTSEYFGFLVLFIITATVSFFSLTMIIANKKDGDNVFMMISWLSGIANLLILLAVVFQYVFQEKEFHFGVFIGELLIIILGAIIFMAAYFIWQEN